MDRNPPVSPSIAHFEVSKGRQSQGSIQWKKSQISSKARIPQLAGSEPGGQKTFTNLSSAGAVAEEAIRSQIFCGVSMCWV